MFISALGLFWIIYMDNKSNINKALENILYGLSTGSFVAFATSLIMYNIEKRKILYCFLKEFLLCYRNLCYIYSESKQYGDFSFLNGDTPVLEIKKIISPCKVYVLSLERSMLEVNLNNYDCIFQEIPFLKQFHDKERDNADFLLKFNRNFTIFYNELNIEMLEIKLAEARNEYDKKLEHINKIKYMLRNMISCVPVEESDEIPLSQHVVIPHILAYLNFCLENLDQILKWKNSWEKTKKTILKEYRLMQDENIKNEENKFNKTLKE